MSAFPQVKAMVRALIEEDRPNDLSSLLRYLPASLQQRAVNEPLVPGDFARPDGTGLTPLMYAATRLSASTAPVLVAFGADINQSDDDGNTPLKYAQFAYVCAGGTLPLRGTGPERQVQARNLILPAWLCGKVQGPATTPAAPEKKSFWTDVLIRASKLDLTTEQQARARAATSKRSVARLLLECDRSRLLSPVQRARLSRIATTPLGPERSGSQPFMWATARGDAPDATRRFLESNEAPRAFADKIANGAGRAFLAAVFTGLTAGLPTPRGDLYAAATAAGLPYYMANLPAPSQISPDLVVSAAVSNAPARALDLLMSVSPNVVNHLRVRAFDLLAKDAIDPVPWLSRLAPHVAPMSLVGASVKSGNVAAFDFCVEQISNHEFLSLQDTLLFQAVRGAEKPSDSSYFAPDYRYDGGSAAILERLLDRGLSVHAVGKDGRGLLDAALAIANAHTFLCSSTRTLTAISKSAEVARLLVERGASSRLDGAKNILSAVIRQIGKFESEYDPLEGRSFDHEEYSPMHEELAMLLLSEDAGKPRITWSADVLEHARTTLKTVLRETGRSNVLESGQSHLRTAATFLPA